jgi:hypothetical protein
MGYEMCNTFYLEVITCIKQENGQITQFWNIPRKFTEIHYFIKLARHCNIHFGSEDGDSTFLRNVGIYRRIYTTPKPRIT